MWFFFENLWELDSRELAIGSESGRSAKTKEPVCANGTEKRNLPFPYLVHSVVEGSGILLTLSNALLFDDLLACLWSKDAEVLWGWKDRGIIRGGLFLWRWGRLEDYRNTLFPNLLRISDFVASSRLLHLCICKSLNHNELRVER